MRIDNFFIKLPRYPLLRALMVIAATVLLIGLAAMGLLVGAAVIVTTALTVLVRGWLRSRGRRSADPGVIEGEFTVVPPAPRGTLPPAGNASTTRTGW
ncbi:MAG: hypothetical protein ACTHM4_12130 [Rhodanobacteraceae bacterium]|jgi:ABC-type transport system involved in cytochrome bd biosynthesis fused ATPase/permease subunit